MRAFAMLAVVLASCVLSLISVHPVLAGCSWSIKPSGNPGRSVDVLNATSALSPTDAWAVGFYETKGGLDRTLTEHWNGRRWTPVPSPNAGHRVNVLYAVTMISKNDVWAVGYYENYFETADLPLTEHWDGVEWTIVPNPIVSHDFEVLYGVSAGSTDDVWAVGVRGGHVLSLIEHWNGSQWSVVPSPTGHLSAVTALSRVDAWAVGYTGGSEEQTLTEHWNGVLWSIVPSPSASTFDELLGVSAANASDIWAVGYYFNGSEGQTLALHWNGRTWSIVNSPNPYNGWNRLLSVSSGHAGRAWAVGYYGSTSLAQPLAELWDGDRWIVMSSPTRGNRDNYLLGVSAVLAPYASAFSSDYVVAVGFDDYWNNFADQTLALSNNCTSAPRPPGTRI